MGEESSASLLRLGLASGPGAEKGGGSPQGLWLEVCVKGMGGKAGQGDAGASRGSVSGYPCVNYLC